MGKRQIHQVGNAPKLIAFLKKHSHSNVIRVPVPFVISDEQLEKGLIIMEEGLAEIYR